MDLFGLAARRERRKAFPINVSIDPGSTEYFLAASYDHLEQQIRANLPAANVEREIGTIHSPVAGTTINLILTGLAAGAGIVVTEAAKEIGKDLWKAIKTCFVKKESQPEHGFDKVVITIECRGQEFKATLPLGSKYDQHGNDVEKTAELFLVEGIEAFARKINDTVKRVDEKAIDLNHRGEIPKNYRTFASSELI